MSAYHVAAGLLILAVVLAAVGIHAAGQTLRGAKQMTDWPTDEYNAVAEFCGTEDDPFDAWESMFADPTNERDRS